MTDLTEVKTVDSYYVKLHMSGPIEIAKQVCREECFKEGLCVTVVPTTFIYTGGEEAGFVVGLLNYPRFPSSPEELNRRGKDLMLKILAATFQHSALMETPVETTWITKRKHD